MGLLSRISPELLIWKYVKIRFKNRGSPCYFLGSRVQDIKNWKEIVYVLGFSFMAFLAQKVNYTINIWLNFVFGSFFEQDHLWNIIILKFMQKDDLNVHVFQNRDWCSPKSDGWFFLNFWLSKDLSIGRIFRGKNMAVRGWLLKKRELCM